jgi:ADP-ribose pyrophosphatase
MIDEGEDSITAAKRELLEETGYNSDNLELLEWHYQDQGCSKAIITTFIAHDCYKVQEQNLDESEIIKVKTLKYNEILEDIKNNKDFNDANSKIAFLSYLLNSK